MNDSETYNVTRGHARAWAHGSGIPGDLSRLHQGALQIGAGAPAVAAANSARAAAKQPGVDPQVDDGHGHRLGAVEHGAVGRLAGRRARANSGVWIGTPAGATLIIGWIEGIR